MDTENKGIESGPNCVHTSLSTTALLCEHHADPNREVGFTFPRACPSHVWNLFWGGEVSSSLLWCITSKLTVMDSNYLFFSKLSSIMILAAYYLLLVIWSFYKPNLWRYHDIKLAVTVFLGHIGGSINELWMQHGHRVTSSFRLMWWTC